MGRKPNPIVSEFFNRGNKLPDSSNRYEHRCKLCGENFPKGRADGLLGHLIKACQAISVNDKQRVVNWSHGSMAGSTARSKKAHTNGRVDRGRSTNLPYAGRTANFNSVGGLNGLNVLAEASRQVGATEDTRPEEGLREGSQREKSLAVDPALEDPANAGEASPLTTGELENGFVCLWVYILCHKLLMCSSKTRLSRFLCIISTSDVALHCYASRIYVAVSYSLYRSSPEPGVVIGTATSVSAIAHRRIRQRDGSPGYK